MFVYHMSWDSIFPTILHVRLAKTQISLRISAVWSVFTWHSLESQGSKISSGSQRRLRSACADAQADLSLWWAHMHSSGKCCAPAHIKFPVYLFSDKSLNSSWYFNVYYFNSSGSNVRKCTLRTCTTSEDSDQPVRSHSLIRIFTGCILDRQGCKVSCWQRRLKSDWAGAQAQSSLRWTHIEAESLSNMFRYE